MALDRIHDLISNPGFVRSRNQIMDAVYGSGIFVEDRTVDSLIKRFRAKVRCGGYDPIRTRSGLGYAWREVNGAE